MKWFFNIVRPQKERCVSSINPKIEMIAKEIAELKEKQGTSEHIEELRREIASLNSRIDNMTRRIATINGDQNWFLEIRRG
jgi:ribosome-interacting GTPase 1